MPNSVTLSADLIREVGEALYGAVWQTEMAKGLGVPRQSIAYYLKSGGVNGAQAAAIVGLVGRTMARDASSHVELQKAVDLRRDALATLLIRLEAR
jgi:hypothetical protein